MLSKSLCSPPRNSVSCGPALLWPEPIVSLARYFPPLPKPEGGMVHQACGPGGGGQTRIKGLLPLTPHWGPWSGRKWHGEALVPGGHGLQTEVVVVVVVLLLLLLQPLHYCIPGAL